MAFTGVAFTGVAPTGVAPTGVAPTGVALIRGAFTGVAVAGEGPRIEFAGGGPGGGPVCGKTWFSGT